LKKNIAQANSFSPDGFPVVALAGFLGHLEVVHIRCSRRGRQRGRTNGSVTTALNWRVTSATQRRSMASGARRERELPLFCGLFAVCLRLPQTPPGYREASFGARSRSACHDQRRKIRAVLATERNHPEVAALFQARAGILTKSANRKDRK